MFSIHSSHGQRSPRGDKHGKEILISYQWDKSPALTDQSSPGESRPHGPGEHTN